MSMHTQGRDDEKLIHVRQPSQRRARRRSQGVLGLVLALALLAGLPFAPSASSQTGPAYELDQFIPLGSGSSDMVAVEGDRMVVKVSTTTVNVYGHDGSDWQLATALVRPLGTPNLPASAPNALALSGDTIVAGTTNGSGAHVWQHDGAGWVHQLIARPEDYTGNVTTAGAASFGLRAVATTGDTIYVGGHRDGENNSQTGAVWVFALEDGTWVQQDKLQAAVPREPQLFGVAIAVDGDRLLIGAPLSGDSGRAHVFERDGDGSWAEAYRLRGSGQDNFGHSVALRGGTAAVAERGNTPPGSAIEQGERAVQVFDHVDVPGTSGIWANTEIPDPDGIDPQRRNFGNSIAIEDNRVLVADGQLRATPGDIESRLIGGVYVFDRAADPILGLVTEGWNLVQTLRPENHEQHTTGGSFGRALASDGDRLAVGAATGDLRGVHSFGQTRTSPPSMIGDLDDLGLGLPNVVPNVLPQLHDTVLDLRTNVLEQFPPVHEIVPGGSPLATDIEWTESTNDNEAPYPHGVEFDGDRMVACSGMTEDFFTTLFEPWFVAYERTAGGWERVQQFQLPPFSCLGSSIGIASPLLDGDTAMIPNVDLDTFEPGFAVYTHDGTEWVYHHDLVPSLAGSQDLNGDVLAIGNSSGGVDQQGAMAIYTRDGIDDVFTEDAVIFGDRPDLRFGGGISVSNGRILVGVLRDRSELRRTLQQEQIDLSDGEQIGPVITELRDAMQTAVDTCYEQGMPESGCATLDGLRSFVSMQFTNPGGAHIYEKVDGTWTEQARLNPDAELNGFIFNLGRGVALMNDTAAFHGGTTLTPLPHPAALDDLLVNAELLLADLVFNPMELANYAQDPELLLADLLGLGRDVDPADHMKAGSTWVYRALPGQSEVWVPEARLSQPMHGYRGHLAGSVLGFGTALQMGNEGNRLMISGGADHLLDPFSSTDPVGANRGGQFIFDRPAGLGGWVHTFRHFGEGSPTGRTMQLDSHSPRIDSIFRADHGADWENVEIQAAHPSLLPDLFGGGAFVPQPCSVLPPGPPPGAGPGPVPPVCSLPRP